MGDLKRQMQHLPLFFFFCTCQWQRMEPGRRGGDWGVQFEPQFFMFAFGAHLPRPPSPLPSPCPWTFSENNCSILPACQASSSTVHINLIIKLSCFLLVASDVLHVNILHFLISAEFTYGPLIQIPLKPFHSSVP